MTQPDMSGDRYPQMKDGAATAAVALSVLIMAYASLFGPAPILVFYGLWLTQIFIKGTTIVMPARDTRLYFLFCVYCILSTLWSDYPSMSLYSSLEYTSLVLCTIIIGRIVAFSACCKGLILGCALTVLASILSGNYAEDPISKTTSLIGFFGSKNMVGFFAELGIFMSLILFFFAKTRIEKLLYSAIPGIMFFYALAASKSASSALSLAGTLAVVAMAWLICKLPVRVRRLAWIFTILIMGAIVLIAITTGLDEVILRAFGKDSSLTGRTYLWSEGIKIGMDHPFLGDGYSAFWVQGRPQAETYWYQFGIYHRSGFHFHDLFVQVFVDLGLAGVILISSILLLGLYRSLRATIKYGLHPQTSFALGLSIMLLIRAVVEVDLVGSFSIGPLLLFSIMPFLARFLRSQSAA